jgi:YD repeat-containing protein
VRHARIAAVLLALCACLSSLSTPLPAIAADIIYIYDELGRLVGVVDPAGDAVTYRYDAVGNLLSSSGGSCPMTRGIWCR